VQITLEGYIIKFVAENHKLFSKEKNCVQRRSQRKTVAGNPSVYRGFISGRRNCNILGFNPHEL